MTFSVADDHCGHFAGGGADPAACYSNQPMNINKLQSRAIYNQLILSIFRIEDI